jgi:hypothetical protein
MDIVLNPAASSTTARTTRSELEGDIARLKARFLLQRLVLRLCATVGLDTRRARDRLRQTADSLACLHYRRQPVPEAVPAALHQGHERDQKEQPDTGYHDHRERLALPPGLVDLVPPGPVRP